MKTSTYLRLYQRLREEILSGIYPFGAKLPSKRTLAEDHGISVITVEHAMSILEDEGYIESRPRSGYYVIYKESELFSPGTLLPFPNASDPKAPATSASPDHHKPDRSSETDKPSLTDPAGPVQAPQTLFPFSVFAKTVRKVLSDRGEDILVRSPGRGCHELTGAIAGYLARCRNLAVSEEQIIIGPGSEYLYSLIVRVLGRDLIYGMEKPSYEKIEQVYRSQEVQCRLLSLGNDGILSSELAATDANVLHITPYRSFPSGITATASKRREYIRWSQTVPGRFIVEDDYESEFTPSTKPEETVFSLSQKGNVIYLNSFNKTIAPSVRISYMVLPEELLKVYKDRAGFYSCAVPVLDQYVLAELLDSGNFERHINRVRRSRRK